jgi:hypothetical protein
MGLKTQRDTQIPQDIFVVFIRRRLALVRRDGVVIWKSEEEHDTDWT